MAITADPRITIHPIDIEHYELMVERGVLGEDDHVELLKGMLSKMSPQGDDHAELVWWLTERFTLHAPAGGYAVRPQLPMRLPPASMPEPDVALAARPAGAPRPPRARMARHRGLRHVDVGELFGVLA